MKQDSVESFVHAGMQVDIIRDEEPSNPRIDDDGVIDKMICFHERYDLGDKHDIKSSDYNG